MRNPGFGRGSFFDQATVTTSRFQRKFPRRRSTELRLRASMVRLGPESLCYRARTLRPRRDRLRRFTLVLRA